MYIGMINSTRSLLLALEAVVLVAYDYLALEAVVLVWVHLALEAVVLVWVHLALEAVGLDDASLETRHID
jgi:hypothetical protein